MIKVASDADRVAVAKLQEDGQGQIFRFWEELSPADQKELLAEIRELDLPKLKDLVQHYRESDSEAVTGQVYEPSHFAELPSSEESRSRWLAAREAGEAALRNGKVAVVLSAGDPGENAGFTAPKGTYPVGPVSGKCLYRLHAEKLLALGKKYRATPPLFVVSSSETHDATVGHFQDHDNFKLNRQDVKHVVQESLPVINKRGQLILRSRCGLALKPTGHGGVMARVLEEDIFKKLEIQGIEYLFFFQVGNPRVQIADPSLFGHHVGGQYDVSSKTVRKSEPDESIGVFCRHNGALTIVRPDQLAEAELPRRLDDGRPRLLLSEPRRHDRLRHARHRRRHHHADGDAGDQGERGAQARRQRRAPRVELRRGGGGGDAPGGAGGAHAHPPVRRPARHRRPGDDGVGAV